MKELIEELRAQANQHPLYADLTLFDVAASEIERLTEQLNVSRPPCCAECIEKAAKTLSIYGLHTGKGHYIKVSDVYEYAEQLRRAQQ